MQMLDQTTGYEITSDDIHWRSSAFTAFNARNETALEDVFGAVLWDVIPHAGCKFTGGGAQLALLDDDQLIGLAWALPTVYDSGLRRINLTYAIDAAHVGKGLATMLSCATVLAARDSGCQASEVCAQILRSNTASARVAQALGLLPDKTLAFGCDTSLGRREYNAFSRDYSGFCEMARVRLHDRLGPLESERRAARERA